jgi:hypothetical protein
MTETKLPSQPGSEHTPTAAAFEGDGGIEVPIEPAKGQSDTRVAHFWRDALEPLADKEAWAASIIITISLAILSISRHILKSWEWNWFVIGSVLVAMFLVIVWAGLKQRQVVVAAVGPRPIPSEEQPAASLETRIQILQSNMDRTQRSLESQRQTALALLAALATLPGVLALAPHWSERVLGIGSGQVLTIGVIGLLGAGFILMAAGFWHDHSTWDAIDHLGDEGIEARLRYENALLVELYGRASVNLIVGLLLALSAVLLLGLAAVGLMA